MRVVVSFGQGIGELLRPVAVASLVYADELALLQVALDIMLCHATAYLFLRGLREGPENPRLLEAV